MKSNSGFEIFIIPNFLEIWLLGSYLPKEVNGKETDLTYCVRHYLTSSKINITCGPQFLYCYGKNTVGSWKTWFNWADQCTHGFFFFSTNTVQGCLGGSTVERLPSAEGVILESRIKSYIRLLHGACFTLCLCLCLYLSVCLSWINK